MSGGWELVGGEWGYEIDTPEGIIGLSANAEQAKLIAAAPRLAAALKACADVLDGFAHDPKAEPYPCDCYSWTEHDQGVLDEARAALREAGIK